MKEYDHIDKRPTLYSLKISQVYLFKHFCNVIRDY